MTLRFLEAASYWSNVAVIFFGALAVVATALSLLFSQRLSDAKDAELERFKADSSARTAEANARAAEANQKAAEARENAASSTVTAERLETANLELRRQVALLDAAVSEAKQKQVNAELALTLVQQKQLPRALVLNEEALQATLSHGPKAAVRVEYQRDNPEASLLAARLQIVLTKAGWPATGPQPANPHPLNPIGPSTNMGVTLLSNKLPVSASSEKGTAYRALWDAIGLALGGIGGVMDPTLPDNVFRLVVGPK